MHKKNQLIRDNIDPKKKKKRKRRKKMLLSKEEEYQRFTKEFDMNDLEKI